MIVRSSLRWLVLAALMLPSAVGGAEARHLASADCALLERSGAPAPGQDGAQPMAGACEGCAEELAPLGAGAVPPQSRTSHPIRSESLLDPSSADSRRIEYPPEPSPA